MALIDLIASGNTDISSFADSYLAGKKSRQETQAAEQTSQLRTLQMEKAQRDAGNYEEDRARKLEREDVQLEKAELDISSAEQQQQMNRDMMKQQKITNRQEMEKFKNYQTQNERDTDIYNKEETYRHITAATTEGINFADYVKENAESIKEHAGDGVDKIVDQIIGGQVPPEQLEKFKQQLKASTPAQQKQLRELEKINAEYKGKTELAAAKGTTPGTPDQATTTTYAKMEQTMSAWSEFDGLEGKKDKDTGEYSGIKKEVLSSVQDSVESLRQVSKVAKVPFDQGAIMQGTKELLHRYTIVEGERGDSGAWTDQDKFSTDSFNYDMNLLMQWRRANPTLPFAIGMKNLKADWKLRDEGSK